MLSINFIRQNPEKVKQACQDKKVELDVDKIIALDEQRRNLIQEVEQLRRKKNKLGREDREKGRELKKKLKQLSPQLKRTKKEFKNLLRKVPNVPADDVPKGNKPRVVRKWGKIPQFDFKTKDHIALAEKLDLVDFKKGSKVSGFRGYFLKNEAVLMHLGLMDWALRKLAEKGFTPLTAPVIDKKESFYFTGHFPWGEKEAYRINDKQYLAGTSEVPMIGYFSGDIFSYKDLPVKAVVFSPCFRKEAGNYGKDTRGLYRLHEFLKIEQIVICRNSFQESEKWLEQLAENSEEMLKQLNLPYRVVLMPTEDMGEPQIKKYDIEVWMPGRSGYGEVMSDSIMGDFQARRAKIKYTDKKGKKRYVHTLNNTALASPRLLIAILENNQTKQGFIKVPQVLQKYVGKKIIRN